MCSKPNPRRIDPCMKNLVHYIDMLSGRVGWKVLACCCGHGKYPMTIVVRTRAGIILDLNSATVIPRKSRFYVKDKDGYYFIPETLEDKP